MRKTVASVYSCLFFSQIKNKGSRLTNSYFQLLPFRTDFELDSIAPPSGQRILRVLTALDLNWCEHYIK